MAGKSVKAAVAQRAWRLIMRVGELQMESCSAEMQRMGISPVMAHFLDEIAKMPPGPMSQLVARFDVDAAWVTDVVDKLEARGDVVRRPSPDDRRVKIIELTASGRRTWERIEEMISTPPPELLDVGERELRALLRIAERLGSATRTEQPVR